MPDAGPRAHPVFDVVVLAGGSARRLGGASKPDVVLAGRRLLDRTLDAAAGAREVVVVGPAQVAPDGVRVTREDPPGGGPVAGLAAGLAALPDGAPFVLVLACDLPRVAGAVPDLLAALDQAGDTPGDGDPADGGTLADGGAPVDGARPADGATLVDVAGRRQPLAAVYRRAALETAIGRVAAGPGVHGAPMRAVVAGLRLVAVLDADARGQDVDTWGDLERAELVARTQERRALGATVAEEVRAGEAARVAVLSLGDGEGTSGTTGAWPGHGDGGRRR